jgi:hypothetical protein
MPLINNSGNASTRNGKAAALPDLDNPLAWRRATLKGAHGALKLLEQLTDDEVRRYMAVARDQIAIEDRLAGLKIASAIAGVLVAVCFVWQGMTTGFGTWVIAGLGLALALGYWPWRVLRCKQLWQKHFDAARSELLRRNVSV